MRYILILIVGCLILSPTVSLNLVSIAPNEIDKIFERLTPNLIGEKDDSDVNIDNFSNTKS